MHTFLRVASKAPYMILTDTSGLCASSPAVHLVTVHVVAICIVAVHVVATCPSVSSPSIPLHPSDVRVVAVVCVAIGRICWLSVVFAGHLPRRRWWRGE
ncbi:hypothetical protein BJ912DRAFT_1002848 [Pholiota molesta]|nr:hypothetical protein BJ912DRAFT_1002848 [Pholiota molesta]